MDLDDLVAGIAVGSARGRKPQQLSLRVVRELNLADKEELENPSPKGVEIQPLAKMRHTHHMLARLLAEGRKPGEAGLISGYSPSRVSVLQQDPAFQELVEYYRGQVEGVYLDVHQRLAALGLATVDELQERLESDPDGFKNRELMDLATMLLDRTVAPPKGAKPSTSGNAPGVTVNVSFVKSETGPMIDAAPTAGLIELDVGGGE